MKLYNTLCEEIGGKNSFVHSSWIQCIEPDDKKKFPNSSVIQDLDIGKLKLIVAAADSALSIINLGDLLTFHGMKCDLRPEAIKLKM